jgi:hypothetical protein
MAARDQQDEGSEVLPVDTTDEISDSGLHAWPFEQRNPFAICDWEPRVTANRAIMKGRNNLAMQFRISTQPNAIVISEQSISKCKMRIRCGINGQFLEQGLYMFISVIASKNSIKPKRLNRGERK